MSIKELKKGEYFTLKAIEEPKESQVYIKGDYDKQSKTYSCYKFNDMNEEKFYNGNKVVFAGFTF